MAEPDPKPPKEETPPEPIKTEPIRIEWGETEVDEGLKKSIEAIMEESKATRQSNERMTKIIEDMNTKAAIEDYEKEKTELLAELEELRPGTAEKYKDEKDLGLIKNTIKLATEWKKDETFSEVEGGTTVDDKDDDVMKQHWRPPGSTKATAKIFPDKPK